MDYKKVKTIIYCQIFSVFVPVEDRAIAKIKLKSPKTLRNTTIIENLFSKIEI